MSAPVSFPEILTLHVTADDIEQGEEGNAHNCAMARALKRIGIHAWVRSGRAVVMNAPLDDGQVIYDFGPSARGFIHAFDDGKRVKPDTFEGIRTVVGVAARDSATVALEMSTITHALAGCKPYPMQHAFTISVCELRAFEAALKPAELAVA